MWKLLWVLNSCYEWLLKILFCIWVNEKVIFVQKVSRIIVSQCLHECRFTSLTLSNDENIFILEVHL